MTVRRRTDGRLDGRVAIITGASRGIGRGIAELFAEEGAAVVLAARTQQPEPGLPGTVQDAADAIRAGGGMALPVVCDVTLEDDLVRLVTMAVAEFGPVDVLVNNAAVTVPGRPGQRATQLSPTSGHGRRASGVATPLKSARMQFEVNLFAPWRLIQLVLPGMIERGRGSIVNISSEAARMPGEGPHRRETAVAPAAYGTSKLALEHLTRCAAYEARGSGVAVNALTPSLPIITPGLTWVGGATGPTATIESFAEAALHLALADPELVSGQVWHSEDALHPELGRRGWLGPIQGAADER